MKDDLNDIVLNKIRDIERKWITLFDQDLQQKINMIHAKINKLRNL